jgi:hypothetical protein
MTSKHDLGPPLAIAGGVAIVAAVIAGFVAVGGPGAAREKRLDQITMGRITDIVNIARCAFNATGSTPDTIEEAVGVSGWLELNEAPRSCSLGTSIEHRLVQIGGEPAAFGDITYEALSDDQIKVCGRFRRPSDAEGCNGICNLYTPFPELEQKRPSAGVHCYTLELKKVAKPA